MVDIESTMEHIDLLGVFGIAFLASLGHCIGMCGGIVLAYTSLHFPSQMPFLRQIPYHLTYNFGRVNTYSILGFIIGGLGKEILLNQALKNIALLLVGILLIILGLGFVCFPRILRAFEFNLSPTSPFYALFKTLFQKDNLISLYALGLCNGLLPCGIVYYFLLTASIAGNSFNGMWVMLIFGLATIPSLLLLGLFTSSLQSKKAIFLKLSGVGMLILGTYEVFKVVKIWI